MRKLVVYNLLLIIVFVLAACSQSYFFLDVRTQNRTVDSTLAEEDPEVVSFIHPYALHLEEKMSRVIGIADEQMVKNKPESPLTNFLADLLLLEGTGFLNQEQQNLEMGAISYFNYGGIRTFIPKGEITVRNIYELMPFDNKMVFLKLKGSDLKHFLNRMAENGGDSLGGVRFAIADGAAQDILVAGKPLDLNAHYWLITNDYVAGGGDDLEMLKNAIQTISSDLLIRDVIIQHLEKLSQRGQSVSSKTDGRMYYKKSSI
jgi:2',3'-cyclic-nucleotide 2'-phosphodiesterase (5'-nucleotidase family)